jgi:hypothetical protein
MLCSRNLLWTVLELIGRNPGMLLAVTLDVWNRFPSRIQDWANILSTDESRFHLDSSDGRSRVYRRVGERYADACVIQRQSFGGGSVMVWGGITAHGRTPLVVVPRNLTGIRTLPPPND